MSGFETIKDNVVHYVDDTYTQALGYANEAKTTVDAGRSESAAALMDAVSQVNAQLAAQPVDIPPGYEYAVVKSPLSDIQALQLSKPADIGQLTATWSDPVDWENQQFDNHKFDDGEFIEDGHNDRFWDNYLIKPGAWPTVDFDITPPEVTVPNLGEPLVIEPPSDPTLNSYVVPTLAAVDYPDIGITLPALSDLPSVDTLVVPTLVDPALPSTTITVPATPDLDLPTVPNAPSLAYATFPTISLTLPTVPDITLPTITMPELPELSLPELPTTLNYLESPYAPEIVDEILTNVRTVTAGRTLIPDWVWNGIWSREAGNIKRQERGALYAARKEAASAGWMLPGPVRNQLSADARDKASEATSELSRKLAEQQAMMTREDFWKALEVGLGCEELLQRADSAYKERLLKAAVATIETSTALYQAVASVFNTRVQAVLGYVQAQKLTLDVALAPLEVFKAELMGSEVDLKKQDLDVRRSTATLENERLRIEHGKLQLQGTEIELRVALSVLEAHKQDLAVVDKKIAEKELALKAAQMQLETYKAKLGYADTRVNYIAQQIAHRRSVVEQYSATLKASEIGLQEQDLELKAALSRLEEYKTGMLYYNQLNEQDKLAVQIYAEEWKGQETRARAYAAWADAIKSYVAGQQAAVQAYGEEIKAKSMIVDAWAKKWEVWGGPSQEHKRIAINAQQAENGLFAQSVARWQTAIQQSKAKGDFAIAELNQKNELNKLDVNRYQVELEGYVKEITARIAEMEADIKRFSSMNDAETKRMGVNVEQYKAHLAASQLGLSARIEAAKNAVGYFDAAVRGMVSWNSSVASVYGTLGGAAYSAASVSLGASSSSSYGESTSSNRAHGYSVNISGEAGEGAYNTNPPF